MKASLLALAICIATITGCVMDIMPERAPSNLKSALPDGPTVAILVRAETTENPQWQGVVRRTPLPEFADLRRAIERELAQELKPRGYKPLILDGSLYQPTPDTQLYQSSEMSRFKPILLSKARALGANSVILVYVVGGRTEVGQGSGIRVKRRGPGDQLDDGSFTKWYSSGAHLWWFDLKGEYLNYLEGTVEGFEVEDYPTVRLLTFEQWVHKISVLLLSRTVSYRSKTR